MLSLSPRAGREPERGVPWLVQFLTRRILSRTHRFPSPRMMSDLVGIARLLYVRAQEIRHVTLLLDGRVERRDALK